MTPSTPNWSNRAQAVGPAKFIAADVEPETAPIFRTGFRLGQGHGPPRSARLRLSALGVCEAWLNGKPVSDVVLTPGWTSYEWRLHLVEHDVIDLLEPESSLGILVGNGWYRGRLGWVKTQRYGDQLAAFADLRIVFADGFEQRIVTDESWRVVPSAIVANDLYDGQVIDARLQDARWHNPDHTDAFWCGVHSVELPGVALDPDPAPLTRCVAELAPTRVWSTDSGTVLIDVGENIVGYLRVRVRGERGARVRIRHAEVLDGDALAVRPLRSARATDEYILSGAEDVFEPSLTFHGFRYAEIEGWPTDLASLAASVTAVVISSDLRRTGHFECSDPDVNRLHANVVRGMRGNMVDVPMDCPQRDERLGWTGDLSAFTPTAAFLFDVKDFLVDWLRDLALEQQHAAGVVPFTVPDVLKYAVDPSSRVSSPTPAAFWGDAAVWVPWDLWEAYGDSAILLQSFESMLAHGRQLQAAVTPNGLWDSGFQFGDWLDPDAPVETPELAKADPWVIATACAFRSAVVIRNAARVLGRTGEAVEFEEFAGLLRSGFQREYVRDGNIRSDCATVYAVAIAWGLLDHTQLPWAGDRLAELVRDNDYRISTGFVGTPFVTQALTDTGHLSEAYRMLLQKSCPSWLYPVTMGATTSWERWDSMLPDGSVNPGDMTSFNHYATGAVAGWLHRVVGGLAPIEPGYRTFSVAPRPGDGIDWATTSLETSYGLARVDWRRGDGEIRIQVGVPEGARAVLTWPGCEDMVLHPGEHRLTVTCGLSVASTGLATDPVSRTPETRV